MEKEEVKEMPTVPDLADATFEVENKLKGILENRKKKLEWQKSGVSPEEVLNKAEVDEDKENARNVLIDYGAGGILGAYASHLASKLVPKISTRLKANKAIKQLKNGIDDSLGHQKSIPSNSAAHESEIKDLMAQNKKAAKDLFEGGDSKKALDTVVKNTKREAEVGPEYMDDIQMILQNDTGLSEKEVNKAIEDFVKEHADKADLMTLIEVKDPMNTYSHSKGVQNITYNLAKRLNMPEQKAAELADAALLHDIGKIQVPDMVINSKFDKYKYPHLFKWMNGHDIAGEEILRSDKFKSKIAGQHHPAEIKKRNSNFTHADKDEMTVTAADLFEAGMSKRRAYSKGAGKDKAFWIVGDNIKNGYLSEDYMDLLKAMDEDGLLDNIDYPSVLEVPYKSMKANAIKSKIYNDYKNAYKYMINPETAGAIGTVAGGSPNLLFDLPFTATEVASKVSPTFKPLKEKLEDIKEWYSKGYTNDEIDKLIANTDFYSNKEVTKLWKLIKEQLKNE